MFLSNAFELTSPQVADLYKNRWQIELFFKWLKQHLKIKRFWGTTENAVRIQIYSAICAYCLVAIIQHDMHLDRSTYEVLQILSMSDSGEIVGNQKIIVMVGANNHSPLPHNP